MENISWNIIDKYFRDNPYNLVSHHLTSYNKFFSTDIKKVFKDNNPLRFIEKVDSSSDDEPFECRIFMGGKNGENVYFSKPIIYDENSEQEATLMYPNLARLRDMTYGVNIYYDIDIEFKYLIDGTMQETTMKKEKVLACTFPIMLHSDLCILRDLPVETRYNMGECKNDHGGYFIIDGKEKVLVSQEKFADNMLYIKEHKEDSNYLYTAEIRSVSEDPSKPVRKTSLGLVREGSKYANHNIVVNVPNIRIPVPLFILMRALGVSSDKEIIEHCLLNLEKNEEFVDLFIPSVHDAAGIFNQQTAINYLKEFTKRRTTTGVIEILMDYFIPHIGSNNFIDKAYFVGHMVYKMLRVYRKIDLPTDRDSFIFKRVELSGALIYQLFRDYYIQQAKSIEQKIDKEFYYHDKEYKKNFPSLIENNFTKVFKPELINTGIRKAFKGDWGATDETKKVGVIQDLNRLSNYSFNSHLRKIILPLDSTAKVVGPRLLHSSQYGFIDPIDTPDGGNCGLHKHMAISTYVTSGTSAEPMITWFRLKGNMKKLAECNTNTLYSFTKVFVNGRWVGVLDAPIEIIGLFKLYRRNGLIPAFNSISFSYQKNEIHVYTDAGRLTRPLFYVDKETLSFNQKGISKKILDGDFSWPEVVSGFLKKAHNEDEVNVENYYYDIKALYPNLSNKLKNVKSISALEAVFKNVMAVVDYLDSSEKNSVLIASDMDGLKGNTRASHIEIHPSLIFGVMGNSVIFPETNPAPRNVFSCGQSRQAVSVYHTNYHNRIDKMGVVLNYGQIPLVKSRYLKYINNEEIPYGVNTIVAIMSYTGYNVEDAILINKASVDRGLFRTTYFSDYESREETASKTNNETDLKFSPVLKLPLVKGIKPNYDYDSLNEYGLIKEETVMDDKKVVIGRVMSSADVDEPPIDSSVFPKKGQLGIVDKSFITEGEEGTRIAKIRVREERIPAIGDKMASRAGQKGTIGLVIPEKDMPYTSDGSVPDLIINPHAIPSRMTIGQFMETVIGSSCSLLGGFGDCTAFTSKGHNTETFGNVLQKNGFNSRGNKVMYSGLTGEQLSADVFMGPTYYMRLKHMVKDKVNSRADGPKTSLTRQAVQGRAKDGGLRIGEMERDGIMAHGASAFLNDSFMNRADEYYMAICNKTGGIAAYNKDTKLMLSPFADGPLKFNTSFDGNITMEKVSQFGRSFSIVRIPYSFKLLLHELQTMNVHMKIITEDNIDHLMSMSYSDNINKLMKNDNKLSLLFTKLRNDFNKIQNIVKEPLVVPEAVNESGAAFVPMTPPGTPTVNRTPDSMKGDSDSESYHPISPQTPMDSPQVNYESNSIEYPGSPGGTPPQVQIERAKQQAQQASMPGTKESTTEDDMMIDPIENKDLPDISQFSLSETDKIPQVEQSGESLKIRDANVDAQFNALPSEDKVKLMKMVAIAEAEKQKEDEEKQKSLNIQTESLKQSQTAIPAIIVPVQDPISILKVEDKKEEDSEEKKEENASDTKTVSFDSNVTDNK
tara:strand:- start:18956 stop:23473 length:4518 start_codon:yes stop_codon:yes gene_type:complete